ncbi:MAG: GLUG motif-containing protein, partial [Planctomycetota bacterium]
MKEVRKSGILRIIPLLIAVCIFSIPAYAKYGGGSGTVNNPYLIYTAEEMNAIGVNPDDFDKHFKLMADIDLSSYTGTEFNIIGAWDDAFTGVFDGNGHTISNFTYTHTGEDAIGLFGYIGSMWKKPEIRDLGLINPNVDARTGGFGGVGSLVGVMDDGTISNCYVEGGSVDGDHDVGGLVGKKWDGAIINCYSTSIVSGGWTVGGLVGLNFEDTITNCYAAGSVSGDWFVGGLVGSNFGEVTGSFWDTQTSRQTTSDGGTGKTIAQMQMESTFTNAGWDFVGETANGTEDIWRILEGQDYPRLWWEKEPGEAPELPPLSDFLAGAGTEDDPYLIYGAEQMNMIGLYEQDWDKHFKLMADIDLSRYTGTDFNIIGHFVDWGDNKPFAGTFDGNGYTISNFSYSSADADGIGLFRYVKGVNAEIRDLGLIGPNIDVGTGDESGPLIGVLMEGIITGCYVEGGSISGNKDVGGLVGLIWDGRITNCFTGSVVSGNESVGGLAGSNNGTIINCYSRGSVIGERIVGGLVGFNNFTITNCYSAGSVTGTMDVGGLVGSGGQAIASFWDIETSGQLSSAGGTGKTTADMQVESTFTDAGWDFVDVWRTLEGFDYPRLRWEKYGGGTGRRNDPYLIYTAEQMNVIGLYEQDWDKHFKLMADIDLSGYAGTDFNIIGYWVALDSPENRPFRGVFDGNGHTISNFTYTSTGGNHIGLFGYIEDASAEIKDLGLIDSNIDAGMGGWGAGSLAGYLREGTITECYVEGGSVSGNEEVGGLLGSNWECAISNCYSTSSVSGNEDVGGLVGDNAGTITNCYSTGSVSGGEWVGGLVGLNWGTITHCYSTGHVEGTVDVGGLVGYGGGAIASFWDIENSGQPDSASGIGKTTAEMQTASTFVGWSFGPVWTIDEGKDYPRLWWEEEPGEAPERQQLSDFLTGAGTEGDPYLIYTAEEFNMIGLFPNDWDKHFKLMADIDLAGLTGTDFNIIGRGPDSAFSGVFDGNGKKILNFTYTSTEAFNVGLFGYLKSAAVIKELGLIDPNVFTGADEMGGWGVGSLVGLIGDGTIISCYVEGGSVAGGWMVGSLVGYVEDGAVTDSYVEGSSVSGDEDVGGLVGFNQGTITNCYAIGTISCNSGGGGLVGNNWVGSITNCYSAGSVTGNEWVGGLAGSNFAGEITNCYSASSVTANSNVGGLVGDNWGEIMDSFWDVETSGQLTSAGGTGKTTAEMQTASTFLEAGWDFVDETINGTDDIWKISEGLDYPHLWWEPV